MQKKFRIFHKELNRYLSSEEWCIDFNGKLIFVEMDINCKRGDKVKLIAVNPDLYIIQQFTGLIDKNNKEIYEGDICIGWRFGSNEDGKKFPFIVEWRALEAADDMDLTSHGFHFNDYYNEFEVIGNICQNKELIK